MAGEFLETRILIFALEENDIEAKRLLQSMLPNERAEFRRAITLLDDLIDEVIDEGDENAPFSRSIRQLIKGGDDEKR